MEELNIVIAVSNLLCGILGIALALPLVRGKVAMNPIYGIRFKRSFESDALWYEINRHGGRLLIRWSCVIVAAGLLALATPQAPTLALGFAPLLYLVPAYLSYRYSRKL